LFLWQDEAQAVATSFGEEVRDAALFTSNFKYGADTWRELVLFFSNYFDKKIRLSIANIDVSSDFLTRVDLPRTILD